MGFLLHGGLGGRSTGPFLRGGPSAPCCSHLLRVPFALSTLAGTVPSAGRRPPWLGAIWWPACSLPSPAPPLTSRGLVEITDKGTVTQSEQAPVRP